jgi:hypothetical protein
MRGKSLVAMAVQSDLTIFTSPRSTHVMSASSSDTLHLFCLILGDDIDCPISVKVSSGETVSELKQIIKEKMKPQFDLIPAYKISIFQGSFPSEDDAVLNGLLENFNEDGSQSPLHEEWRLNDVFRDPIDDHIHVVIKPPVSANHCIFENSIDEHFHVILERLPLLPGERQTFWLASITHRLHSIEQFQNIVCFVVRNDGTGGKIVLVTMDKDDLVANLIKQIKEKTKVHFGDFDHFELILWKPSIKIKPEQVENLFQPSIFETWKKLDAWNLLGEVFAADEPLYSNFIHVVAQLPPEGPHRGNEFLEKYNTSFLQVFFHSRFRGCQGRRTEVL